MAFSALHAVFETRFHLYRTLALIHSAALFEQVKTEKTSETRDKYMNMALEVRLLITINDPHV